MIRIGMKCHDRLRPHRCGVLCGLQKQGTFATVTQPGGKRFYIRTTDLTKGGGVPNRPGFVDPDSEAARTYTREEVRRLAAMNGFSFKEALAALELDECHVN